jgi:enterobacteria phage integrase
MEKRPQGSLGAVISEYFTSTEFTGRAANTQKVYRLVLERVAKAHGHKPIADLKRRHIKKWRDSLASTPGMANMLVSCIKLLLAYAVDQEHIETNPAARLKLTELGEHRAWTDTELSAFEKRWKPGSMERRCYELAVITGQRCGDLAAMTQAHRRDGAIYVKQEKTGKEVWPPETSNLKAELSRGAQHFTLLANDRGEAFSSRKLSKWFGKAVAAAGLPKDCVLHGLRKVCAVRLAERGMSEHQIASITGQTIQEVARYTRAANQKKLARSTAENRDETRTAKRTPSRTAKQSGGD